MKKIFFFTAIAILVIVSCTKDKGDLAINPYLNCDTIHYSTDIAPLISFNCSTNPGCHISGFPNGDLTSHAGIVLKIQSGAFYDKALGPNRYMPFGGPLLSDSLVAVLQCWVNQGYPNN